MNKNRNHMNRLWGSALLVLRVLFGIVLVGGMGQAWGMAVKKTTEELLKAGASSMKPGFFAKYPSAENISSYKKPFIQSGTPNYEIGKDDSKTYGLTQNIITPQKKEFGKISMPKITKEQIEKLILPTEKFKEKESKVAFDGQAFVKKLIQINPSDVKAVANTIYEFMPDAPEEFVLGLANNMRYMVNTKNKEISELKKNIDQINEKLENLDAQYEEKLDKTTEEFKKQLSGTKEQYEAKLNKLEQEKKEIATKTVRDTEKKLEKDLQDKILEAKKEATSAISEAQNNAEEAKKSAEQRVNQLAQEKNATNKTNTELIDAINNKDKKISDLAQTNITLEQLKKQQEDYIQTLNKKYQDFEQSLPAKYAQEYQDRLKEKESQLKSKDEELTRITQQYEENKKTSREAFEQIKNFDNLLKQVETDANNKIQKAQEARETALAQLQQKELSANDLLNKIGQIEEASRLKDETINAYANKLQNVTNVKQAFEKNEEIATQNIKVLKGLLAAEGNKNAKLAEQLDNALYAKEEAINAQNILNEKAENYKQKALELQNMSKEEQVKFATETKQLQEENKKLALTEATLEEQAKKSNQEKLELQQKIDEQFKKAQEKITTLADQAKNRETDLAEEKKKFEEIEKNNLILAQELTKRTEKLNKLTELEKTFKDKEEIANKNLEEIKVRLTEKDTENTKLNEQLEKFTLEKESAINAQNALQNKIKNREEEIQKLQNLSDKEKQDFVQEKDRLEEENKKLAKTESLREEQIKKSNQEKLELQQKVDASFTKARNLQKLAEEKAQNADILQLELDKKNNEIIEIQKALEQAKKNALTAQQKTKEAEDLLLITGAESEDEKQKLRHELNNLKKNLENQKNELNNKFTEDAKTLEIGLKEQFKKQLENQKNLLNLEHDKQIAELTEKVNGKDMVINQNNELVKNLNDQLGELENKNNNLADQNKNVANENKKITDLNAALEEKLKVDENNINELKNQFNQQLKNMGLEHQKELKLQAEDAQKQLEQKLTDAGNQHKIEIQNLNNKFTEDAKNLEIGLIEQFKKQLEDQKNLLNLEHEKQITELTEKVNGKDLIINQNNEFVKNLNDQLGELENKNNNLAEQNKNIVTENKKLIDLNAAMKEKLKLDSLNINDLNNKNNALEKNLDDFKTQTETLTQDYNLELQKIRNELKRQADEQNNQLKAKELSIAELQKQLEEVKNKNNRFADENTELRTGNKSLKDEISRLNDQLKNATAAPEQKTDVGTIKTKPKIKKAKLDVLEPYDTDEDEGKQQIDTKQQYESRFNELLDAYHKLLKELASLKNALLLEQGERAKLEKNQKELMDLLKGRDKKIAELEDVINTLRREASRLNFELEKALAIKAKIAELEEIKNKLEKANKNLQAQLAQEKKVATEEERTYRQRLGLKVKDEPMEEQAPQLLGLKL